MKDALDRAQILQRLTTMTRWRLRGDAIERDVDCKNFDGSIAFVERVAEAARTANHHPELRIAWNVVTVTLVSHDVAAISERDFALAAVIDRIADRP